jgi:hypothetical protein
LSKIYIEDTIFFSIYIYKFIIPEIYLGDILFSPTKGEGPLLRASRPTITATFFPLEDLLVNILIIDKAIGCLKYNEPLVLII